VYRKKGSVAVDDENLIRRIKSGDTEALDALIQKHYDDIYTYCYRRLGNQHDAQDVTQDVFLHFCRNFDTYTQIGKCKNYLYAIAHNLCINTTQKKIPIPLEDAERESSFGNNIPAERFEAADSVQVALNELPQEQKEVILLRFYHDLKLKEIAQIMNSRLSVTKYRLSRGLETLSKLLSKEDWL
jgi:RNA polymerase sigma-70 factor (ECF subfamily)